MMWTAHIEGGPMRVNHAAVSIGDKIYSFGGYCSTEEFQDWDPIPVYVMDTYTMRWSNLNYNKAGGRVPFQRYGHSAIAYGEKVYLWGGRNNAVQCETLACFDTKTFTWSNPPVTGQVPFAKDGHTACLIQNRMYIFAGFEYHSDQYTNELHYLDLDTMKWKLVLKKGDIPTHRDFHSATAIGDRMYVYGGRGDLNNPYNSYAETYCPLLYYLDTKDDTWHKVITSGAWPQSRRSHSAWAHNGYLYIFGGYNSISKKHFNDIWRYSPKNNLWHYLEVNGALPSERRRHVSLMYGNKTYTFGGTSPKVIEPKTEATCDRIAQVACLTYKEDLIDNSDMHILDFHPSLKTLGICAVLKYKLDRTSLPWDVQIHVRNMSVPNNIGVRKATNPTG